MTTGDAPAFSPVQLADRSKRTIEAFKGAIDNGADPELAISIAAREHLGPLGETDALARVVMAIVRDFERESDAKISSEPMAMSRVIAGYLLAMNDMRDQGYAELNLPFLAATPQGPKHLQRRLTPGMLDALSYDKTPAASQTAPASEPGPAEPSKPRRWWQFW